MRGFISCKKGLTLPVVQCQNVGNRARQTGMFSPHVTLALQVVLVVTYVM